MDVLSERESTWTGRWRTGICLRGLMGLLVLSGMQACISVSGNRLEEVPLPEGTVSNPPRVLLEGRLTQKVHQGGKLVDVENVNKFQEAREILKIKFEESGWVTLAEGETDSADMTIAMHISIQENWQDRGAIGFARGVGPLAPFIGIFAAGAMLVWPQSIYETIKVEAQVTDSLSGRSRMYLMEEILARHFSLVLLPVHLVQWVYPGSAEEDILEKVVRNLLFRMQQDGYLPARVLGGEEF